MLLEDWLQDASNGVDYFTTNGQLQPKLSVATGQIKRFRSVTLIFQLCCLQM